MAAVLLRKRMTVDERFEKLVSAFKRRPGVTLGGRKKKGFGSSSLCVHDKIFARVSSKGLFVVKLPRARADELIAQGAGMRFNPGHGRIMKEWFAVRPESDLDWKSLADEARRFVGAVSE